MARITILALFCLSACTAFPVLDNRISAAAAAAPYPDLVPLGPLLARATASDPITAVNLAEIDARVAALNARAARLRQPVINSASRARMRTGVAVAPLR